MILQFAERKASLVEYENENANFHLFIEQQPRRNWIENKLILPTFHSLCLRILNIERIRTHKKRV